MKNFLFKVYLNCVKFALKFTRTDENQYVILNGAGRSGSNGFILYKYLKENRPDIAVELVEPFPSSHLSFATWKTISRAKYIFVTHEPFKIKKNQVCVELWHGIPLKRMGLLAKNMDVKASMRTMKIWAKQADYVVSSSALYESLMSACVGITDDKFLRIGFPRIDALHDSKLDKKAIIRDLFQNVEVSSSAKLGIYMPTFRYELENEQVMADIESGNFLAVSDFDLQKLNAELQNLNQYLLIKLHPYEQKLVQADLELSNIAVLDNSYLSENDLDLYEILNQTDYLITDFSSIYFDYLHLNKPIYFLSNHLTEYVQARGLLLDPYELVTPGKKVTSQAELLAAVAEGDTHAAERDYWLNFSYSIENTGNTQRLLNHLSSLRGK